MTKHFIFKTTKNTKDKILYTIKQSLKIIITVFTLIFISPWELKKLKNNNNKTKQLTNFTIFWWNATNSTIEVSNVLF